ncbi:MAG: bacteriohemerythrin [Candidatus Thiodiazotropha sp. (ex Notomyrtea botanica)]|nr:bacteriohemerythrin [Candidatus Thiodiazotropha sp. (ex Notomyrtea botanica)]
MKDLVWSNTLSVEVDEIDEDHRRLVDLFNILAHSVAEGDSPDYQEAVLEELISCTVWHFKHEERLMLKYAYEELAGHKTEHQDLINSALGLQRKFLQAGKRIENEDFEFLEHWLTEHILVADMKLGAYLAEVM